MRTMLMITTIALAACSTVGGGADGPTPTTTAPTQTSIPSTTTTSSPSTTVPDAGPAATLTIIGFGFSSVPTLAVGDVLEISNQDDVPHTWTDDDGSFDVSLQPGGSASHTFTEAGTYEFFCRLHPSMQGTLDVED